MYPKALDSNQEEWLQWHERLNHIPYSQMKVLAKEKILPSTLNNIKALPLCPSCAFGGSKRKAWRTKDNFGSIKKSSHDVPGSLVCVDQLISSQPGLLPQSSGYLTASRIWACNIFLDVNTRYGFGFMMHNTLLEQTIKAKQAFEFELFVAKLY